MTPRIAILVPVLAAAGIAVAGCGGGSPSASGPASPTPPAGSGPSRPGVSVAPSNVPPAAGSAGATGAPGASGATGNGGAGQGAGQGGGGSTGALPAPNGNTGLGSLPAGFPLPSGTMLGRIAVDAKDITAPMQVPDGEQAAAFWKKELPAAGYKITAVVHKEIGDIKFTGNGCKRGSDLAISGEQVAFLCRR
jgi:hypothetical protein